MNDTTTVKPAESVRMPDAESLIIDTAKDNTIYLTPHGGSQDKARRFVGAVGKDRELVELEFWSKDGLPILTMVAPTGDSLTVPVDKDALEHHREYFTSEVGVLIE